MNCTNLTTCSTCHSDINRKDAPNCSCKDGYYEANDLHCEICKYPCDKCISDTVCITCKTTLNRGDVPTCVCNDGYFDDDS